MKRFGFLLILLTILTACQKDYNKTKQAYKFIPSQSSAVITVNELNDFISSIENHNILSNIYNDEIKRASVVLKSINTNQQVFIAFSDSVEINDNYIILTENNKELLVTDSIPNHISETLSNSTIQKTKIDTTTFYHNVIGNVFAASNNIEILKSLDTKNENTAISRLIETSNSKSVASVVFKSGDKNYSKLLFSNNNSGYKNLNYTILDLGYTDSNLFYNGVLTSTDSITSAIDCFKNTLPQKINSIAVAPYNTTTLKSITYNDFSVFNKNKALLNLESIDSTETFLNFTNEIAIIDNAIILHSLDSNLVLESIEDKSNLETFRDTEIFKFGKPKYFETKLKPFVSYDNAQFFTAYENYIVFSNSLETLKNIISNALNNNTLEKSDAYTDISKNLSDEASLFIFKNNESLSKTLNQKITGYNANAVQFVYEDNYAHVHGIIQKFKKRAATNSVTEAFTNQLEAEIITAPQTLKNHISKAHDIVLQDVNNTLYLFSNSGSLLWKKQLQGRVLGEIQQIDSYKNGRLQLVFATKNRVYILDRNGKDVSGFPLKFNDPITQPISVFDYDKNKKYRLLVTQGKNLIMYDAKGKSVKGFDYKSSTASISSQPKHFRIGSKDYIVFSAGETLKILNRQGNTRVNVKDKIRFSNNALYLYQNKFTTTNTLGQLVQVDTKGSLSTKNLNLTDNHHIATTSKTLVSMTENKLQIKSRTIDLDFGEYTAPKIFYINDKIYISTTDLQAKKVYLFDSQAESIANFPVFGTSAADLQELDKDKGLELITQSDNKTLIVYKLH